MGRGCLPINNYETKFCIISLASSFVQMDVVKTSDMMEAQLRTVSILRNASTEMLAGLVGVWREAQQRVYSCYKLSAVAYFKFLQLCGHQEVSKASLHPTSFPMSQAKNSPRFPHSCSVT